MEDIDSVLKHPFVSIIATDWGVWELFSEKPDSTDLEIRKKIQHKCNKLYNATEKGRDSKKGISVSKIFIGDVTNLLSSYRLQMKLTPWNRVNDIIDIRVPNWKWNQLPNEKYQERESLLGIN